MAASNNISITCVPSDVGSVFPGKSRAPDALQAAGIVEKLRALGFKVKVHNALPDGPVGWVESNSEPNGARNETAAIAVCQAVKNTIATGLAAATTSNAALPFQLILGGECLICPAIMSALTDHLPSKRIGLLYV